MNCYAKGKHDFAVKQTDDQMKLLKYQRRLEEEFNRPYMDLSLHQTIYRLTTENNIKVAEQLRKEFKVISFGRLFVLRQNHVFLWHNSS
jgi:hypothetical protein